MGSDLYMDERSFRPRKPRAVWIDTDTLLVETDVFYHGYREYYRGPVTDDNRALLEKVIGEIPPKPEPRKPETAFVVFHCAPDYTARPDFPTAIFEDVTEAVEFAKSQPGYGFGKDWFVKGIKFFRKEDK